MINKIFLFIGSPLDQRDVERFGFEILQRNGFEVEAWDFTEILNPQRFRSYTPPDKGNAKCRFFSTKYEALLEIKRIQEGSFVVCIIAYDLRSRFIFRALTKKRVPYSLYSYNYPVFNMKKRNIIKRLLDMTPQKVVSYLFSAIPIKYLGIRPADIVLVTGGQLNMQTFGVGAQTNILWSHNYDYELYLQVIKRPLKPNKKMGVFIDQYLPFHPDNIEQPVFFTAENYYPRLCDFFDHLEKQFGVHVVIAAHPRSQYDTQDRYFGDRPVIRGRTAELVSEAGFVILHDSASINFAVLFRKPMIFIATDLLLQCRQGLLEFMASLFDKKVINVDQSVEIDWDGEMLVDEKLYAEYIDKYIKKSGTDDTAAWQVFADFLKQRDAAK